MKWLFIICVAWAGYLWFASGGEAGLVAQEIIKQGLKDPNSANWHNTKVVWSKNDLSLVDLDVSAKNGFGGMIRSKYCVCINRKTSEGLILGTDMGCGISDREPASKSGMSSICESRFK